MACISHPGVIYVLPGLLCKPHPAGAAWFDTEVSFPYYKHVVYIAPRYQIQCRSVRDAADRHCFPPRDLGRPSNSERGRRRCSARNAASWLVMPPSRFVMPPSQLVMPPSRLVMPPSCLVMPPSQPVMPLSDCSVLVESDEYWRFCPLVSLERGSEPSEPPAGSAPDCWLLSRHIV